MKSELVSEQVRSRAGKQAQLEARIRALEDRVADLAAARPGQRRRLPPFARWLAALPLLAIPLAALAATITSPHVFVNGTVADADQVNANFAAIVDESNDQHARIADLESPPFVSDWIEMDGGDIVQLQHGLGRIPERVTIQVSPDLPDGDAQIPTLVHLGGHIWKNLDSEGGRGVIVTDLTASTLVVRTGNSDNCPVYDTYVASPTQRVCLAVGYVRILAWD